MGQKQSKEVQRQSSVDKFTLEKPFKLPTSTADLWQNALLSSRDLSSISETSSLRSHLPHIGTQEMGLIKSIMDKSMMYKQKSETLDLDKPEPVSFKDFDIQTNSFSSSLQSSFQVSSNLFPNSSVDLSRLSEQLAMKASKNYPIVENPNIEDDVPESEHDKYAINYLEFPDSASMSSAGSSIISDSFLGTTKEDKLADKKTTLYRQKSNQNNDVVVVMQIDSNKGLVIHLSAYKSH